MDPFGEEWDHLLNTPAQAISHTLSNLILKAILWQIKKQNKAQNSEQFAQISCSWILMCPMASRISSLVHGIYLESQALATDLKCLESDGSGI